MQYDEYGAHNSQTVILLHGGSVYAVGGLSLGGQIAVEMLTQRPDICRFALIESVLVKPIKLTHALIKPTFGMSYGLVKQKWFAKLQAAYLGIPRKLFDDYYRDTCKITKEDMIAFLKANCGYSVKPALGNTKAKVHIVFGSKEQASICTSGKRYVNWNKQCPMKGEKITVYYEPDRPDKYAVIVSTPLDKRL